MKGIHVTKHIVIYDDLASIGHTLLGFISAYNIFFMGLIAPLFVYYELREKGANITNAQGDLTEYFIGLWLGIMTFWVIGL